MKPIETGCLAVVIGSVVAENNGKVVTVGRYLGDVEDFKQKSHWEISCKVMIDKGFYVKHAPQNLLLRIDGDPELDEELAEQLNCISED